MNPRNKSEKQPTKGELVKKRKRDSTSPETTMTSFSTTCSRLSQYLKEQQRIAAAARPTTTMSLLPGLDIEPAETEDKTTITVSDRKPMNLFPLHSGLEASPLVEEKAKLTIFYGGHMLVLDDFPAEKAKDLMMMAGKVAHPSPPAAAKSETGALPLTRRACLQRFMEKRKERIHSSKAPYQVERSPVTTLDSSKLAASLPWFLQDSKLTLNLALDK